MENRICVYAITKNEEQFVERWYESMKEADAVVVLDTGSTDNTVSKLRELGATVEVKIIDPWRFDTARNESLKLVPDDCNILVCTDLDEVLEPGWADILRDEWEDAIHERCIYSYAWSHLDNGAPGRVFMYDKIHSRNWEWRAPVHEMLCGKTTGSNNYPQENTLYLFDEIHLHHYPDKAKSRASYLPLLELRVKENPNDLYGKIYLAHEYFYREKFGSSIRIFNEIIDNDFNNLNEIERASCYLFLGDDYKAMSEIFQEDLEKRSCINNAIINYTKAIDIDPTYIEPYLNMSRVYMDDDKYDLAYAILKRGVKKSYRHYTWLERDASWSYEPWDLLCLAAYYSGDKRNSIIYALKALEFDKDNARLNENLKLCMNSLNINEL